MSDKSIPDFMTPGLMGLEARHTTNGGLLNNHVKFAAFYAALLVIPALGHKEGIFADNGFLWFIQALSLVVVALCVAPEISAFTRIGRANAGSKYTLKSGRVENNKENPVDFIFNRRPLRGNTSKCIDKLPVFLVDPEGAVGELELHIDGHSVNVDNCRIGVIGFDRYQVTACEGLNDLPCLYISVRIAKPTEVLLAGQFLMEEGSYRLIPGSKVILIEPALLNNFMRQNMYRVLLLCSLSVLQIIIW